MAKQKRQNKAILLPISDDGDPFEVDDMVGFESWEGMSVNGATATAGSAFLGIIRAIVGTDATIEYLDTDMQPRGDMVTRPLASLREYILPGSPEAAPETPADTPPVEGQVEVPPTVPFNYDATSGKSTVIEVISTPSSSAKDVEFKAIVGMEPHSVNGRTIDGIAAVMGNVDDAGDITHPGAFRKTLQEQGRRVMFTFNHEITDTPRARIDEIKEIPRGELPQQIKSQWPQATGGLFVRRTYLDTPRGEEAFQGVVSGAINEMSYSYKAVKRDYGTFEGNRVRNLREVRLLDVCDTTLGVNSATMSRKGAIPYGATPRAPDNATWDGSAQVKSASIEDLKAMCAWANPDGRDDKREYYLPHHTADGDHAVVWEGVKSAMGALVSARGGDIPERERRAVYDHLAKHYEEFGQEPPDYKMSEIAYSVKVARDLMLSGVDFKAGRLISAINMDKLKTVMSGLEDGLNELQGLLGAAEPPADTSAQQKALTDPAILLALLDLQLADLQIE